MDEQPGRDDRDDALPPAPAGGVAWGSVIGALAWLAVIGALYVFALWYWGMP